MTVKQKRRIGNVLWYITAIFFSIIMVMPFLWTLVSSFKPNNEIFSKALYFWSDNFTLDHYRAVFKTMPIIRYSINSFLVAIGLVISNLFFGSLAGYTFSKLQFKGRRFLFKLLLSSMMLPAVVTMIPNFLIIKNFPLMGGNNILGQGGTGMLNMLTALVLPVAVGAYGIFVMKQCYEGLPDDIGEAARIDGCSEFQIFYKMYMPLTKSTMATLGFMTFISGWNVYLSSLLYITDKTKFTLQQGMAVFSNAINVQYGAIFAGSVLTLIPVIILFLCLQRYFTQGIAFTGGK